jgi:hypothetical protein
MTKLNWRTLNQEEKMQLLCRALNRLPKAALYELHSGMSCCELADDIMEYASECDEDLDFMLSEAEELMGDKFLD